MREDWIECTLGEVFDFIGGGTPSKSNPDYWNGNIPWASIKDLKGDNLISTQDFITEEGLKNSSANIANENEIILATRISPGTPILSKIKTAINQDLKVAKPKIESEIEYFFWLFNTLKPEILKLSSGTTVLGINLPNLKSVEFLLPPISLQKAIVKKIEELFSSLDSGIADLKKAQNQLVIYRQAVLKKAFEGDWEKVKLDKLITFGPTNGMYKPKSFYGSGTPILRIDGFYDGKINSWDSLKKLELEDSELETYSLQNDDIVVNRVNSMPYVGKSAIVKNLNGNCVFESNIMRLRVDDKIISPNFLVQFLISPNGYSELQKNVKHAVNQSSINQADVKNAIIPIPSLKEQHQIVQEIESRLSVCDKVEKDIALAIERSRNLRQSILKKAFEGKLLSEGDIAKCKQHKDYQPASVLLEKIKAEKKQK